MRPCSSACTGSNNCWGDLYLFDPNYYPDETPPSQLEYITQYLQEFHDVLHSANFADPTSGYASYIDVDSFVDQVIINELGREIDSYTRSAYYYKDQDTKLFAGPLWDYNLALGVGINSTMGGNNMSIEGWQFEQAAQQRSDSNDWINILLTDPAFMDRLTTRWQELRQGLCSDAELDARDDELADLASRNLGALAVDDLGGVTWNGQARGSIGHLPRPVRDEDVQHFGRADAVDDFAIHLGLPLLAQFLRQGFAGRNANPEVC